MRGRKPGLRTALMESMFEKVAKMVLSRSNNRDGRQCIRELGEGEFGDPMLNQKTLRWGQKKEGKNGEKKEEGGEKERKEKDCPQVLARRKGSKRCRHVSVMKDEAGIPTLETQSVSAESRRRNFPMRQPGILRTIVGSQTVTELQRWPSILMTVFDLVRGAFRFLKLTFMDQMDKSGSEPRRSDLLTTAHAEGHRMATILAFQEILFVFEARPILSIKLLEFHKSNQQVETTPVRRWL
jgi:hypothetical protein